MNNNNYPTSTENYASEYSENKFWNKLKNVAKKAGLKVIYLALVLYYTLIADSTSREDKLLITGALGYLILPIDLIPDFIPVVGFADDLAALIACYKTVKRNVTPEILSQAELRLQKFFGKVDQGQLDVILKSVKD